MAFLRAESRPNLTSVDAGGTIRVERLTFRDPAEVSVYRALRVAQESMPAFRSIGIAPNAAIRVSGHTWHVDFLVTYGGRCGVIEVDGASHANKWSSDRGRDQLLEDAGVAYVARIDVADTARPPELELFVQRFLGRLGG